MKRLAYLALLSAGLTAPLYAQTSDETLARAQELVQREKFEEARTLLADGCRRDPGNVNLRYQLGYVLYRERRLEPAKAEFQAVVKLAPPALYSRYFLGRIALLENHPAEAAVWLEAPAHAEPPVMDALTELGSAYRDSGQFEKAAEAFQSMIRRTPWDGKLQYQVARVHERLGQKALARDEFATSQRLLAADAAAVQRLVELGQHVARREKEPAARIYRELVSDRQADPDILIALGVLLAGAGLEAEALEPFRLAAERQPGFFQAQYNTGLTLLKLDRAADAVGPLSHAVDLMPESFDANSALALAYLANGGHGEAVKPLQAARRLRPDDARVAGLLGSAYLRSGHPAEALPALRDAIARDPKDAKLHFLVIEALQANKDEEGALAASQETVRLFPQIPQAHLFLAQQLVRIGRYQDAGPFFQKASDLDPDNVESKLGLADVLQRKGDAEASLAVYRAVLALEPQNLPAHIGSAKDLAALNRYAESRDLLEGVLSQHPESAALHFELARVYARLGDRARADEHTRLFQRLHEKEPK